jgi:hypothetical protein
MRKATNLRFGIQNKTAEQRQNRAFLILKPGKKKGI